MFTNEMKELVKNRGVVVLLILAPLVYPMLYCGLYWNETLLDVPIAVVDPSNTSLSRQFIRHMDASPDVAVHCRCTSLEEARQQFASGAVHGVLSIPADFSALLQRGEQAHVSVYSDMSSFLYYRSMVLASNYVALEMGQNIQVQRLSQQGIVGAQSDMLARPLPYEGVVLYNSDMGFASFLMPAILILILHQTLFFGIGMAAGADREDKRRLSWNTLFTRSSLYVLLYALLTLYVVGFVPKFFHLPHLGNPLTLLAFAIPFLLATVFFALSCSVFNPNRETQLVLFLFFSLILLFLSGISWPESNLPAFWRIFAQLFPATFGIRAYIKINSMGAGIAQIQTELVGLWIQTAVYFTTALLTHRWALQRQTRNCPN